MALQCTLCHNDESIPQQNRQMKHISAEQKRRFNIKMGFDTLNSLISNNSKLVSDAWGVRVGVVFLYRPWYQVDRRGSLWLSWL